MKKIDYSFIAAGAGQPFKQGTWKHLQEAYQETINALALSLVSSSGVTILYGCENTGSGLHYIISAGAVYYNGEIYLVDAVDFTSPGGQVAVGTISITPYTDATADPVIFTNLVSHNVHLIRKVAISSAVSGTGIADFTAWDTNNIPGEWKSYSIVQAKITVTGGVVTSGSGTVRYRKVGKTIEFNLQTGVAFTSTGSQVNIDLSDILVANASLNPFGHAYLFKSGGSNTSGYFIIAAGASSLEITNANAATLPAGTYSVFASGIIEIQ